MVDLPPTNEDLPTREFKDENYAAEYAQIKSSQRKRQIVTIITLVIVGLVISIAFFAINSEISKQNDLETKTRAVSNSERPFKIAEEKTICVLEENEKYEETEKIKAKNTRQITDEIDLTKLSVLYKERSLAQLTDTASEVKDYIFNKDEDKVAFISEKTDEETKAVTRMVYLYDLVNKTTKKIFEQDSISTNEPYYVLEVMGVSFSPNSSSLAITTTTGLYVYNLATDKIQEIFNEEPKEEGAMNPYGYYFPKFSANERYLMYNEAQYEGHTTHVYDLQKNALLEKNYKYYIEGDYVADWYENKIIVLRYNYTNEDTELLDGIYLVDPLTEKEELMKEAVEEEKILINTIISNVIYFTNLITENSGKFGCDEMGNKYPIYDRFYVLNSLDLKTNETEKVITVNDRYDDGKESFTVYPKFEKVFLGGKEELLMSVEYSGQYDTYNQYFFVINKDKTLTEISF